MTLTHILVFGLIALLSGWLIPRQWRIGFLLITSLIATYWFQPSTPIRNLDFWLPTGSAFLTVFVWAITRQPGTNRRGPTWIEGSMVWGAILVIGLTRYIDPICCLTPSRPPDFLHIITATVLATGLIAIIYFTLPGNRILPYVAIGIILGLFIILKSEPLSRSISAWLRASTGQSINLANALDLPWLGFSYLAFRLIHVLRDHQSGKLPSFSLGEFITYAIFFPTYTAGPIDRSQRFIGELQKISETSKEIDWIKTSATNTVEGAQRILIGAFKKFVLADSLALIALNPQNATQTKSTFWMWILLLAYGLRIYLDFAGYTDIAIGLGRLIGFKLPENFNRPYLAQNLTAFWNSWHITLAQWFRSYYFYPLTRAMRTRTNQLPIWLMILIGQLTTLALIGLWHGITWNFFIWGVWHGLGLFMHNRWSDWIRPRVSSQGTHRLFSRLSSIPSWLLTFLYVTVGWVWFALPNPGLARNVLMKLAGF